MSQANKFSKLNIFLIAISFILVAVGFLANKLAFAQETTPAPTEDEGGLAFPISDLGNCSDLGSCMDYCEDPVNYASCVDYAKKKGFYVDDEVQHAQDEFWAETQGALGCDSQESCFDFCSQEANHEACSNFASDQGIPGGIVVEPEGEAILAAAQEVLGCDSASSCDTFCSDTNNSTACTNFADKVGLIGGLELNGPGDCKSLGTCQFFCSDPNNFTECSQFVPNQADFSGPGGCNSTESCRSYCEENPLDCRTYAPGSNGVYVPITCAAGEYFGPGGVCTSTELTREAGECAQGGRFWNGSTCDESPPPGVNSTLGSGHFTPRRELGGCASPAECYDYCAANSGSCAGFNASTPRPDSTYNPYVYYTPGAPVNFDPLPDYGNCNSPGSCYDFCRDNPGTCQGFDTSSPRPLNTYSPGTYYTPPIDIAYYTPPIGGFYTTPIYYTPSGNVPYLTPSYYTPGSYSTPHYYTPNDLTYTTPNYYTPGTYYYTPQGTYPTPNYLTPYYYTPPIGSNYTTPSYYTPPTYTTPYYYTPSDPNYTTPSYSTPPIYSTPSYYTPSGSLLGSTYNTPTYYTPPEGSNYTTPSYFTPTYYTPGGYYTPTYYTPSGTYTTPVYYSPSGSYTTPTYYTPSDPNYATPTYYTPTYATPSTYYYPSPDTSYTYPTPSSYTYPSPDSGYTYPTPSSYTYPSPSYGTPTYGTPTYETPAYGTPTYGTPTYETPTYAYPTPVQGVQTEAGFRGWFANFLRRVANSIDK